MSLDETHSMLFKFEKHRSVIFFYFPRVVSLVFKAGFVEIFIEFLE